MIAWLQGVLAVVPLWVKILIMVIASIICTMLPSPVPLADISFIAVIEQHNVIYWILPMAAFIAVTDTLTGILTYYISDKLVNKVVKKEKTKQKIEKMKNKVSDTKWADIWVFLATATPIPYTITIYAAAALEYNMKKFIPINLIGRFIKYAVIGVAFYFGYNLIKS